MQRLSEPPKARIDVLILAAHAPDLAGMRAALGENLDGHIRGLYVSAKAVGLGLAMAGAGTASRIKQLEPRCIIFSGTCGVYPGQAHYRPNDVIVANRFALADPTALSGHAAFPEPMQTSVEAPALICQGLGASGPRVRMAPVASTLSTTIDDALAAQLLIASGCEAENLEAFSVAIAAAAAHVPFAVVLGVANAVGSKGREDWLQFQRSAVIAAADVITTWVHNGAPGLPHS
ncbi:MAG: hypothetical protein IPK60_06930 [Sandaracinaceae bacterium]|nr:hypothetical protein [Sandaracinaceae bacterium]